MQQFSEAFHLFELVGAISSCLLLYTSSECRCFYSQSNVMEIACYGVLFELKIFGRKLLVYHVFYIVLIVRFMDQLLERYLSNALTLKMQGSHVLTNMLWHNK